MSGVILLAIIIMQGLFVYSLSVNAFKLFVSIASNALSGDELIGVGWQIKGWVSLVDQTTPSTAMDALV